MNTHTPNAQATTRELASASDAALGRAVRWAAGFYRTLGREPLRCDVCIGILYDNAIHELSDRAQPEAEAWQPIETCPRNTDVLLYYPPTGSVSGRDDGHDLPAMVKVGRHPHWTPRLPTLWASIPPPPAEDRGHV